jgi:hypothetical protein
MAGLLLLRCFFVSLVLAGRIRFGLSATSRRRACGIHGDVEVLSGILVFLAAFRTPEFQAADDHPTRHAGLGLADPGREICATGSTFHKESRHRPYLASSIISSDNNPRSGAFAPFQGVRLGVSSGRPRELGFRSARSSRPVIERASFLEHAGTRSRPILSIHRTNSCVRISVVTCNGKCRPGRKIQ